LAQSDGLFFDNVSKFFGGTKALSSVSLHVERGEIVALLGENGAGKSTLIKTLGGLHAPDEGRVLLDGSDYFHKAVSAQSARQVAFIHQDLGLIEWMSISENIALAVGFPKVNGFISWRKAEDVARRALSMVDCDFDPSTRVSSLTRTEKSLVAIARALVVDCDFLVLDEPTASLPADEVERLFAALRPLKEKGVGMIYVSHRLDEIFQIADRAAVLRDGEMVGIRNVDHTSPEELVTLIVGRKSREIATPELAQNNPVLRLEGFQTDRVQQLDFSLLSGEVLGLVGLRGAGHEDIGRALFGLTEHRGNVLLNDEKITLSSPRDAMAHGIGFVAGDRIVESVAATLSICENAFLNPLVRGRGLFQMRSNQRERADARSNAW